MLPDEVACATRVMVRKSLIRLRLNRRISWSQFWFIWKIARDLRETFAELSPLWRTWWYIEPPRTHSDFDALIVIYLVYGRWPESRYELSINNILIKYREVSLLD